MNDKIYPMILSLCFACLFLVNYCLTKISTRAERLISRIFSVFIVPSPFFVHCPYKGRINRTYYLLTGCKGRTVKYEARGFEVPTELARSVRKKRGLSISRYGMSNPVNK